MSNSKLMGLTQLKNKPSRSSFDLSFNNSFTCNVGELMPVCVKEVMPGDKFHLNLSSFTRTPSLQTCAFTRLKEYYDVFFVPYNLLWRFAPDFFANVGNTSIAANSKAGYTAPVSLPYVTLQTLSKYCGTDGEYDTFGFPFSYLTQRLVNALGYGKLWLENGTSQDAYTLPYYRNMHVNIMRFLAYQKICEDFFRFDRWQSPRPWLWNLDYVASMPQIDLSSEINREVFALRRCTWEKDYFTGLLPNKQFGSTATVDVNIASSDIAKSLADADLATKNTGGNIATAYNGTNKVSITGITKNKDIKTLFDVLQLRQANALQKWQEVAQSGRLDYMHQVEKHFGVKPSSSYARMATYLDGFSNQLQIGEVENTNLVDDTPTIRGNCRGSLKNGGKYEFKEHGIFMVIYHATPLLDWQNVGIDPFNTKLAPTDFAIPEYDKLGMQPTRLYEMTTFNDNSGDADYVDPSTILGYAPRYAEYKTSKDIVQGEFLTSLKSWCAPLTDAWLQKILLAGTTTGSQPRLWNHFFEIDPTVLDTVFGVSAKNANQLYVNAGIGLSAVRNLDFDGLPY